MMDIVDDFVVFCFTVEVMRLSSHGANKLAAYGASTYRCSVPHL